MLLADADRPESVRSGAHELALFLSPEAREVEAAIEGKPLALEEFCSLADGIRSDTSQILEENIPVLQAKVTEMRGIYAKVDRLEAFVNMVGHHAALLGGHMLQAERDHGAFPQALRRWLGSTGFSSFRNGSNCPQKNHPGVRAARLYRTEDYVPTEPGRQSVNPAEPPALSGTWGARLYLQQLGFLLLLLSLICVCISSPRGLGQQWGPRVAVSQDLVARVLPPAAILGGEVLGGAGCAGKLAGLQTLPRPCPSPQQWCGRLARVSCENNGDLSCLFTHEFS